MFTPKVLLALVSAGVCLLPVTGCGTPEHSPDEKYYLIATNIKVPYWQSALSGLNRASAQLKVRAEMIGPETYDPKAQHEEFQRVLRQKPTGILISPGDPNLMKPDIDAAMAQGIPVITMDSDAESSKRLFFIGTDNYKAGAVGGELTARLLNGKGNVVMFTMPEQANLNQRRRGYEDIFAVHPQIKVTKIVNIKGDPDIAFDSTKEILESKTKVDALVCLEAIACPEVAEVVNRQRLAGKVIIVAMDTDPRTLEWIQKGVISATIGQKPFTMAFYGLKSLDEAHHHPLNPLAANWAQNSFSPIPTFVDTGATLIDKGNVEAFLSERQSSTPK